MITQMNRRQLFGVLLKSSNISSSSNPANNLVCLQNWFGFESKRSFATNYPTHSNAESARTIVDPALKSFLTKTYVTTGVGILGFLGSAHLFSQTALAYSNPTLSLGAGFLGAIGSSLMLTRIPPTFEVREVNGHAGYHILPDIKRTALFGTLVGSFGLLTSPVFGYFEYTNPSVIAAAAICSTFTITGASAYALTTRRNLRVYESAFVSGLFGVVGISLGSLVAQYMGYQSLAINLHSFVTYSSLVVFTGLSALDTQLALRMYQLNVPDHLQVSASLFMNFANLFQSYLSIFGRRD